MEINALEKHITDTVKEWQMKIGYMEENMKLYYPDVTLMSLLQLEAHTSKQELDLALQHFSEKTEERLGGVRISNEGSRYCIEVPAAGCRYIKEQVPDSEFLGMLLMVITTPGNTMEEVRACFASFAVKYGLQYREEKNFDEETGQVFSFEKNEQENYVYCVEEDDFGLTYHRFTREDYEQLLLEE